MHSMSTKFGVDSSSRLSYSARTNMDTQTHKVTNATDHCRRSGVQFLLKLHLLH